MTLTNLGPGTEYDLAVQAEGYSDTSPVTHVRTAYGPAKVSHRNLDWSPTNNQIQPALTITNLDSAPLDLTTVRLRYHIRQPSGTAMTLACDWAAVGCDAAPGRSSGPLHLRWHRPNWTDFDESRDVSWRPPGGDWYDNSRITLDIDGVRAFGDERC